MAYTTIDDASKHMQVLTYRGDSTSTTTADRTLTNDGNSDLQPDLVWIFNRDTATNSGQRLWDSTRGVGQNKGIQSSSTGLEGGGNDPEFGYVNTLRSLSQGRSQFTMHFNHYAVVPAQVSEELQARLAG